MTTFSFWWRSLTFYWRAHLAVVLGVAIGTAVLGGALLVGSSVRGSLRDMTLSRLGEIDHVLSSPQFVREQLARDLAALPEFQRDFDAAAPAIVLPATIEKRKPGTADIESRAGRVTVYGLDERLWKMVAHSGLAVPSGTGMIINSRLAEQLTAADKDDLILQVELPAAVPRDSLLGQRDDASVEIPVTVSGILDASGGMGRLGLTPDQQIPLNAFVPLKLLQERLGLAAAEPRGTPPLPVLARVNAIFISAREESSLAAKTESERLGELLTKSWQLSDVSLRVVPDQPRGYVSLQSAHMLLGNTASAAGERAAKKLGWPTSPVMVYLSNELSAGKPDALSRYSVVAGVAPELFAADAKPPFGPFQSAGDKPARLLGEGDILTGGIGEITVNDWLAKDLQAGVGDVVSLSYHLVGSHGEIPEEVAKFRIHDIVKLEGTVAEDQGLTPHVPGITDVESFDDWDQPFPMKKVTTRDDEYWTTHRATPKAFVTLRTAQHLWKSRYGDLTSLRAAPKGAKTLDAAAQTFAAAVRDELGARDAGLAFLPIKAIGLKAAGGTTDFAGLFIGFSFFIIVSALMLIGLLFRLGLEQRTSQVGLLLATGFTPGAVSRMLLAEGAALSLAGGLVGLPLAIGYAALMVHGLRTWWVGAIGTPFIVLHLAWDQLLIGWLATALLAGIVIWTTTRSLRRIAVRQLLAGRSAVENQQAAQRLGQAWPFWAAAAATVVAVLLAAGVITGVIPETEAFAGFSWRTVCFFLVGLVALVASSLWLRAVLGRVRHSDVKLAGAIGVAKLGQSQAYRQPFRTQLTVGLISLATFLIVAIAAGRRNPAADRPVLESGNGGYSLIAESSVPILADLNSSAGRVTLNLDDEDAKSALAQVNQIVPFRVNPGENASCLNIFQTAQPTVLGVSNLQIQRGGFEFVGAREKNPWTLLEQADADGTIPVFGDMNTLQYSLHKGPGTVFELRDEQNRPFKVRIAGMLDNSLLQGVLLMGDAHFRQKFPSRGYQYFLIDLKVDPTASTEAYQQQMREASAFLESRLPGFDAVPASQRLADFLSVQNTYLSTFQTLGGLGLLLGTLGLATVMLRNVIERRNELAVLRAVGFRNEQLAILVLAENGWLLAWGLVAGTAAALVAMSPQLASTGADFSWSYSLGLVATIFVVGMLASLVVVVAAVRMPLLAGLKNE